MYEVKTKIFAHRGASGLVPFENTINSFQKAIEVNADGIELDVRKSSDNVLFITHNDFVGELTTFNHSFIELKKEAKKIGFDLPTLEETLIYCKDKIFLDIEVKEIGFEKELLSLILKYYPVNKFFIRSFHQEVIIKIKELNKNVITCLLVGESKVKNPLVTRFLEVFPTYYIKKTKCDIISPHYKLMMFNYVKRLKNRQTPISVWTVNDELLMDKMINKYHVEYLITNYPDKAIAIRDKKALE